jgi:CHRD domain
MVKQRMLQLVLVAGVMLAWRPASAQDGTFKGRLSPVPVESATIATITGSGAVTAVLKGRHLSVSGTFQGMQTPATVAQVHLGPRGVRGPVMFDLTVKKGTNPTSGTISAELTLSPEQVEAVKGGRFYVQIHSEKAPDGNLWGWLLPIDDLRSGD